VKNTEVLIVGQGIAGSVMAHVLMSSGVDCLVVDLPGKSSSSRIAAGVYNPINFRTARLTWKAHECVQTAVRFYETAEHITGVKFHKQLPIVRVFQSQEEQSLWNASLAQLAPFAGESNSEIDNVNRPFGSGLVLGGGMIDTAKFLKATQDFLMQHGSFMEEEWNWNLIHETKDGVVYDNRITAQVVISCEGFSAEQAHRPFPVLPTQGETLLIKSAAFSPDVIVNGAVYLAPVGDGYFICGATYKPGLSEELITPEAKTELRQKLEAMMPGDYEIVAQRAGIRPAGRDKKPVLGKMREFENVYAFNGLGSKGVMQAPLLAQLLWSHVHEGLPLPSEVDIARFRKFMNA
jgi:glycine oxidase